MSISPKKKTQRKKIVSSLRREQEEKNTKRLAQQLNFPYVNLSEKSVEIEALSLVSKEEAKEASFVPFQKYGMKVGVATTDSDNLEFKKRVNELERKGFGIETFICSESSLQEGLKRYKEVPSSLKQTVGKVTISEKDFERIKGKIDNVSDLTDQLKKVRNKSTTHIIEILLAASIKLSASDIHITPQDKEVKIRYRIDGIMHNVSRLTIRKFSSLLSRIKLLADLKLNIHASQDGRYSIAIGDRELEVRVSLVPGENGEDVVMRVLDPEMILSIEELGLHSWYRKILNRQLKAPNGLILICGPTGSGKTTTLYAALRKITNPEVKVISIENPIEYHLGGVSQTQVNPESGYTFAEALKSGLRQDPDVILVGEIRAHNTASTALQASLTGHLVFSTLHTNDAAGAIPRLAEMGVRGENIAPALNLVISQRLIRRVCKHCRKEYTPSNSVMDKIKSNVSQIPSHARPDLSKATFYKPQGCIQCNNTGYKGRVGIFEMFELKEDVKKLILTSPSIAEVRKAATEQGMVTMQQDGLLRVIEGTSTLEDLERITGPLEE